VLIYYAALFTFLTLYSFDVIGDATLNTVTSARTPNPMNAQLIY